MNIGEFMKNNYSNEIIDLTSLNVFESVKKIILTTNYSCINSKRIKYKVNSPNIEKFLKNIPLRKEIELISY